MFLFLLFSEQLHFIIWSSQVLDIAYIFNTHPCCVSPTSNVGYPSAKLALGCTHVDRLLATENCCQ